MNGISTHSCTSFDGYRRLATGSLQANALAVKSALENGATGPVLIFDDETGRMIEVDTRGTNEEVIARLAGVARAHARIADESDAAQAPGLRSRGRPRLGVVAREVTLLPRHWDWLAAQPGGASVTLRKLVEEARRANGEKDKARGAHERAYHFMLAIGGDLPGFEEATRALFANDSVKMSHCVAAWPRDVRDHAMWLAFGDGTLKHSSAAP
ncbi:DUF2239 family protein [Paraburkholderia sp.]|uniref:DUF2239 family protein n=1 Tax=Paraburkholderia sp. TaxID=1926495 RepID=UPI0039E2370B